jgi:hypothetical protein
MFAFVGTNGSEDLVLILILKYSSSQMTPILKLHIIHQKMVMILFQQIGHGTNEGADSVLVFQFTAFRPGLDCVICTSYQCRFVRLLRLMRT